MRSGEPSLSPARRSGRHICQAFAASLSLSRAPTYGSKLLPSFFPLQVSACSCFLSCNRNNVSCVKALALLYHLITYKENLLPFLFLPHEH